MGKKDVTGADRSAFSSSLFIDKCSGGKQKVGRAGTDAEGACPMWVRASQGDDEGLAQP